MKTKKIIAESMPLALKMVRQQLGDNAIIVNTKTIKTGGIFGLFSKQKFEVTAYSTENEDTLAKPVFSMDLKEKRKAAPFNSLSKDEEKGPSVFHKNPQKLYDYYSQPSIKAVENKPAAPPKPASAEGPLLDELQDMKKLMMSFLLGDKEGKSMPPGMAKWVTCLKKQGVDEEVVEYIVSSIFKKYDSLDGLEESVLKKDIFTIVQDILAKRIPETNRIPDRTRMINIIGPTGVGKTTSIAKLATEQVLKQKRKVAMITTDVYRIAAVEQLKTYAGILNVPIEVVRSGDELEAALKKLENYDLIYMDTTGRNYKEAKNRESINEFLKHPLTSENYLALSLTTKFEDLQGLLEEFLESPVKKLILTKFDETSSYGSILNIAYKYPYQLAYITNGQSVPEDITTIDAALLTGYLLGEGK